MKQIDTTPLYDLVDDFRSDCALARVIDGCLDKTMLERWRTSGDTRGIGKRIKPTIDFDGCHVLDFGYMFNVGADNHPDVFTEEEVQKIKEPVIRHGVSLAFPKMLLVERTSYTESRLFLTYVYEKNDKVALEYYYKDGTLKHWAKFGHVEDMTMEAGGVMQHTLKGWGLGVPDLAMPEADQNPANHYVRMTITLLAMLMRRGDDVEQVYVERSHTKPLKGFQKKSVQSVSVIRLHKQQLIPNIVDEAEATIVRTVTPHDRGGTVAHRIKDASCQHVWREEYRDANRWRNRCPKCDSCEFWRGEAKVKGGAQAITLHTVVP